MFENYFKTAWRNLIKNKFFSAINILGLSIGLACCILMFLFIQYELGYDKFNPNAELIYRVTSQSYGPNGKTDLAVTPAPWAPLMLKDYPEIKTYTRLLKAEKTDIGRPGLQHFYESDLLYADSTLFDVFRLQIVKGDSKKALDAPNSIILTAETAKKYFGDENPIGKTLEVNSFVGKITAEVTAVAKELPANAHFKFNSIVSLQTLGDLSWMWSFHMFQTYLLLNPGASAGELETKLPAFADKYINNNPQADGKQDIHLQPVTSIHLHSNMVGEIGVNSDITYIYVFGGVAIFVLLIACFNFTNLSTARSLTRAKEVGLRKVVGAERRQLLGQFLSETTLFALISLLFALAITWLVLPLFNQVSERELGLHLAKNSSLFLLLFSLVVTVGLVAGFYPALVLSAFKPVEVLKGKFIKNNKGVSFRKFLVTLQFAVSIILIASTILVKRQLNFLQNKKLGFDKENVAIITLPKDKDSTVLVSLKASLLNEPSVVSVAASSSVPGVNVPVNQVNDGSADLNKAQSMQMLFTDEGLVSALKMKMIAGRSLSADYPTDKTEGFVVNEEVVRKLRWKDPQAALGKTIQWVRPDKVLKKGSVIGVVENFNISPLSQAVQPLVMHYSALRLQYLYVRFRQISSATAINAVEKKFTEFFPKQSFEYSFLDDTLNHLYTSEQKLSTIFSWFSLLAIVIACLGVLGLSLYSIQQRTKEIGIRKVLGAGVANITTELLKEFLKPMLIASVAAIPITWFLMHRWLQDFAYRTNISWWIFVVAGALAIAIALITMSSQTIRAARANPVKSLRSE